MRELRRSDLTVGFHIPPDWYRAGTAALLYTLFALCVQPAHADCVEGSYACNHQENHEQYQKWRSPPTLERIEGISCCNQEDCRPVRAHQLEDGRWVWWNGDQWSDPVPPEAMLKPDMLGDGRSHACGPRPVPYFNGGRQMTYCFTPGQIRM